MSPVWLIPAIIIAISATALGWAIGDTVISKITRRRAEARVRERLKRADRQRPVPVIPGDPLCPWCWPADVPVRTADHADCTCGDACDSPRCRGGWGAA